MQKSTIATSLAILLSSVGLNALNITNEGVVGAQVDLKPSSVENQNVGVNINLSSGTEVKFSEDLIFKDPPFLPDSYDRDPSYIANTGVLVQGSVTTLSSNDSSRKYIYFPYFALSSTAGTDRTNLFENKTGHSVTLDNVSVAYGDIDNFKNPDFGFYIGGNGSALDFGVETELLAKGNEFYGVYATEDFSIQGKLTIKNSASNEIIGMALKSACSVVNKQSFELQIDAQDKTAIGVYGTRGGGYVIRLR